MQVGPGARTQMRGPGDQRRSEGKQRLGRFGPRGQGRGRTGGDTELSEALVGPVQNPRQRVQPVRTQAVSNGSFGGFTEQDRAATPKGPAPPASPQPSTRRVA